MDPYLFLLGAGALVALIAGPELRRRHARADAFEKRFLDYRASIESVIRFEATPDTSELLAAVDTAEPALPQMSELRLLGNLTLASGDEAHGAFRIYVDSSGTTLVYVMKVATTVLVSVESYSADADVERWTTVRSASSDNTAPPFNHSQSVGADASLAHAIGHRRFAPVSRLRSFATVEHAAECFLAFHERTVRWRWSRPAEDVLREDLRLLLGAD